MNANQIVLEASSLPLEHRARVADCLLQTLTPVNAESDEAWLAVTRKRLAECDRGEVDSVPGADSTLSLGCALFGFRP